MKRFTEKEANEIHRIFRRLEPTTLASVQIFDESQNYFTCRTFGDIDRNGECSYFFQNFSNFTPGKKKILDKMKNRLPFEPEIFVIREDIVRIVWKSSGLTAKF